MFDPDNQRLASAVFDAAPVGFVLTQADGRIAHVNQELLRIFGYTREQVVGQLIEFLLPERFRGHHVQLRSDYSPVPTNRALGAGRNLYALHTGGHEFPVEIGLKALELPEGTLILATVIDISERIRLGSAFRDIFNASPYGKVLVNQESRIVMANPRAYAIFGYVSLELTGMPLGALLPERHRQEHEENTAGYRKHPEVRSMGVNRDLTALRKDGKEVPVEIGLSPVEWGGVTMTLATVTDISQRKKMELDLRQANSDLEEFMHVASHDLRAPLSNITGLIEWALEDLDELAPNAPESLRNNLDRISAQAKRIERLLRDLLAYARAGKTSAEMTAVDPRALIEDILAIQPLPEGFELTIHVEAAPFEAVRTPLETALRNLIGNAVKHHDLGKGLIEVKAEADGGYCRFTVADDGPGIPEVAQARVFKIFQTLSAERKPDSYGIGLAVAKRLVEAHGGTIEVRSKDGRRGTAFIVRWPRFARKELEA